MNINNESMPTVKSFMTKNVIAIESSKTILEAAELMSLKEVGDLVITESDNPVGIVTERDFVRRVVAIKKPLDAKVSEIMTSPLRVIDQDSSLKEAARTMLNCNIRRLPVIKDNKLIGIITATDFAKHLSKKSLTDEVMEVMGHYPVPDLFCDKQ
jgi:CBS domain-containing protein